MIKPIDYRLSGRYWGFSADTTDERAKELFERRFGVPPTEIVRDETVVLCKIPVKGVNDGQKDG